MLSFKELKQEDYVFRWYAFFKAECAFHGNYPVKLQVFDEGKKVRIAIIMRTKEDRLFTRYGCFDKAEYIFLSQWLRGDFPELE